MTRTFQLFSGCVLVTGSQAFAAEFRQSVALSDLIPTYDWGRARQRGFWGGVAVTVLSFIVAAYLGPGFHFATFTRLQGILVGISMCAAVFALAHSQKLEWVTFRSGTGGAGLSVIRTGKDSQNFDAFVQALTREIERASGRTGSPT